MSRLLKGESILQKYRYDEIRPTFKGNPVPFFLMGSPDASNSTVPLPFIEMQWMTGNGRAYGTDLKSFIYNGVLTFSIFMPKGLNPFESISVVSQIEESVTHRFKDYPEGTVTFGGARIRPTRTVGTSEMTVFEVDTNLILR